MKPVHEHRISMVGGVGVSGSREIRVAGGDRRGGTVAVGFRAWVGGNGEIPDGDAEGVTEWE